MDNNIIDTNDVSPETVENLSNNREDGEEDE